MGCLEGGGRAHPAARACPTPPPHPRPSSTALVVSTENITHNLYLGNQARRKGAGGMGWWKGGVKEGWGGGRVGRVAPLPAAHLADPAPPPLPSQRSMLIPGCIFRLGGAALVMTNRPAARRRAK